MWPCLTAHSCSFELSPSCQLVRCRTRRWTAVDKEMISGAVVEGTGHTKQSPRETGDRLREGQAQAETHADFSPLNQQHLYCRSMHHCSAGWVRTLIAPRTNLELICTVSFICSSCDRKWANSAWFSAGKEPLRTAPEEVDDVKVQVHVPRWGAGRTQHTGSYVRGTLAPPNRKTMCNSHSRYPKELSRLVFESTTQFEVRVQQPILDTEP